MSEAAQVTPQLSRRQFLVAGLSATGGLLVGLPAMAKMVPANLPPGPGKIGFYVEVLTNGDFIIGCSQPEIGQGIRTAMPMIVAEELDVPWDKVLVQQMPLGIVKTADGFAWKYGGQGAGGSNAIISGWQYMREVGATARQMLVQAAANHWNVSPDNCRTEAGVVVCTLNGKRLAYGEVAAAAALLPLPDQAPPLKDQADFKIVGQWKKTIDRRDIVTGKARFGIDTVVPGMRYASITRSPYLDGTVASFDDSAARKVPGVIDVFEIKGPELGAPYLILAHGVAVVADSTWAAFEGRKALKIEWNKGPHQAESTETFWQQCETLLEGKGQMVRDDGDFDAAIAAADKVVTARYYQPYINHAPLEPQNCFAHVTENAAHIIVPTQSPSGCSRSVNSATGIPRENITVEMTRVGGGFGRRLTTDYSAEAAMVSQQSGLPIQLVWSREDDIQHDFFRPSGIHEMRAGLDSNGTVTAWTQRLASASKYYRRPNLTEADMAGPELYNDDFPSGIVENRQLEYFSAKSGVPRGSWRAPAHNVNAFAVQSFMDEIAHATGQDPLELRLKMYGEDRELPYSNHGADTFNPYRLSRLLKKVTAEIGYGKSLPKGRAIGIASHFTFGGYTAHAVEVTVSPQGDLGIERIVAAVDCGLAVNPQGVDAMLQGGTIDGLSTALNLQITVKDGQIVQSNFHDYPLMRLATVPAAFETFVMPWGDSPAGMGEIGLPSLSPALANAIFNACGVRIRKLPLLDQLRQALA